MRIKDIRGDKDITAREAAAILGMDETSVYGMDGIGQRYVFSQKRCEKMAAKRARVEASHKQTQVDLPACAAKTEVQQDTLGEVAKLLGRMSSELVRLNARMDGIEVAGKPAGVQALTAQA